ncbi:hypothetical protein B0T14DRAFT_490762 [Immersiella caudata]|uniref:Uncharacterized protein n=1 Tax=Immersiella caudata TaxID=314043 RepID=A0AA40CBK3_9PEZI|nr:hypothetical protein B0T14DRAFT_490762 [Immersiella caudata]
MASSRRQKSICPSIASHTSWNPFNLPGPVRVSCFADVLEIIRQRRESNANLNGSIGSVLHRSSTNLLSNPNANAGVRQVLNRSSTNLLSDTAPGGSRRHANHSRSNLLSTDNPLTTSKPTEAQPKINRKPLPVVGTNPFLDRASSAAGSALYRASTLGSTSSSRGAWSSDFQATTVTSYTDATNIAFATSAATNDSTLLTRYKRATDTTFDSAIDVEGEGDDSYRNEGLGLRTPGSSRNEHGRPRAPRGPARLAVETPRYEFMPDSGGESSSTEAWWKTTKTGKEELKNSQVGANVGGRSRGYAGKGKEVDRGVYHESRGHGRELSHKPVDKGKVVDRNEFQRFGDYDSRDSDSPTLGTTGEFRKGHRRGFEGGGTFGGEARYTFDGKGSDSFGEGD